MKRLMTPLRLRSRIASSRSVAVVWSDPPTAYQIKDPAAPTVHSIRSLRPGGLCFLRQAARKPIEEAVSEGGAQGAKNHNGQHMTHELVCGIVDRAAELRGGSG